MVTDAASPAAGAAADCVPNTRAAFAALFQLASTPEGRATVEKQLGLCRGALQEEGDAKLLAVYLRNAWDTAAMSSYAAPSPYFTGNNF